MGRIVQHTERRRSRSSSAAGTAIYDLHDDAMAANNAGLSSMDLGVAGNNRSGASTPSSVTSGQANGGGAAANYMSSLPAGHQQDLNYLFEKIQELKMSLEPAWRSNILSQKRATTNGAHTEGDTEGGVQSDRMI